MTQNDMLDQYLSADNQTALEQLSEVDRCLVKRHIMNRYQREYRPSSYAHLDSITQSAFFNRITAESLKPEALQKIREAESARMDQLLARGEEDFNSCALQPYSGDIAGNHDRQPKVISVPSATYIDL